VGGARQTFLFRAEYFMLATKVVDRFGNWTKYSWSNDEFARLNTITSGVKGSTTPVQTITVHYDAYGHIDWAKDGTRTWTYEYQGNYDLKKVTLPDGSFWKFGLGALDEGPGGPVCDIDEQVPTNSEDYFWYCWAGGTPPEGSMDAAVVHPSGATITFHFENHFQYSATQPSTYTLGLKTKTITGAGLSDATWKFDHMLSRDEVKARVHDHQDPSWLVTDQINPDKSVVRRAYGLLSAQAMLVGELHGSLVPNAGGSGEITSSTTPWVAEALSHGAPGDGGTVPRFYRELQYTYPTDAEAEPSYKARVGIDPLGVVTYFAQSYASERRLPRKLSTIKQQGVTFKTEATGFDEFARPTTTTFSSQGNAGGDFSRTEQAAYKDDKLKWVVGLPLTVKDGETGETISEAGYDSTLLLPNSQKRFGILQQTMGYNADGTLAWVADGNTNKTTFSTWYRGVPKTITFPGAVTRKATVSAVGDIESVIDELGAETKYAYDQLGRLHTITFPTEGAVWSVPTTDFAYVDALEKGLPAGHWRQTTTVGNGRTTTYFDSRWNPVLTLTEDTMDSSSRSYVVKRFDSMGRETFTGYPLSDADLSSTMGLKGVTTEYDALGRVVRTKQDGDGTETFVTTTQYLSGFQTLVTNPRSKQTTTRYQVFGEPTTSAPVYIAAPEGVTTSIVRDDYGNPSSITRSGPEG
jgi:YD repeat-containing protein